MRDCPIQFVKIIVSHTSEQNKICDLNTKSSL